MLLYLKKFKKIFIFNNNDVNTIMYLFASLFLVTAVYDYFYMSYEGMHSVITMVYYNVVTASTVGYGDFSPTTLEGKILTSLYIPIAISLFAAILSVAGSIIYVRKKRYHHGVKYINRHIDVLIVGGEEEKVTNVIRELLAIKVKVGVVNNLYKTIPHYYKKEGIYWVQGSPSLDNSLEFFNHNKIDTYIVLSDNVDCGVSDSKTIYATEKLREFSNKRIIAEVVSQKNFLDNENIYYMLPSKGSLIAMEAIKSNSTKVINGLLNNYRSIGQYNTLNKDETRWLNLSESFVAEKKIAIGYFNNGNWEFFPSEETIIPTDATVKYISYEKIQSDDTTWQNVLVIGSNMERMNYLQENYFADHRFKKSNIDMAIKDGEHIFINNEKLTFDNLSDYIEKCSDIYTHIVIMGDSSDLYSNSKNYLLWKSIRSTNKHTKIITEIVGDIFVYEIEKKYEDSKNQFISFFKTGLLIQELQDEGIIGFIENISKDDIERINKLEKSLY